MTDTLHLDTSIHDDQGVSSLLAKELVEKIKQEQKTESLYRSLSKDEIPNLSAITYDSFKIDLRQRNELQKKSVALSDRLIDELEMAKNIVLALPMYNFGVPSEFKAWLDHIVRTGKTFRFGVNGPQGLLQNKKLYVIATRGGKYAGTENDHQTPFIKQVFDFIGISDIEFIYVEGLAVSAVKDSSIQEAREQLNNLKLA